MYFEVLGSTDPSAQTVVLSSGLGGSANFWKPQLSELTQRYRVVVYDQLGTGRSPAVLPDQYRISNMADELLELLDHAGIQTCHVVGHALGGLVAMEMALKQPERLTSMVLINAWSSPNPHTLRCFNIRKAILASCEKRVFLQMQALILYPPDWIAENIEALEAEEAHLLEHFPEESNLLKRIAALSEFDIESQLSDIDTDALIVANNDDLLVPWQRSMILDEGLPSSTLKILDYGGHASTVTATDAFNSLLMAHLAQY
ncbi:pyrimidine utilization protein D [Marinomonas mediterranea]|uniref:pyrimidine utilization protein D n=1 Tax=Marinomonas mediterranea TaxID=119864 RepID=UPI0023491268|nr:pyrimidine utilization protein D [Marinomonas mediterranea]WCN12734.1 pyrimidine utilization protein D [Marinomonas mediterranea]